MESQAVQVDKILYISGSLGLVPETGDFAGASIKEQTEQTLKNIGAILEAAGCDYSSGKFESYVHKNLVKNSMVKTTVLLADMTDFDVMNNVYKQYFCKDFPARVTYQVAALPKNARVEIEAIAVIDDARV
ncbi:unnamed protein product [Thelazia callipaeda]|uniref:2-iminobutanoate/2-iminopropanoate deaminase n=1 Tax=Thelazia callipaeda TaxID=103827 RepID=A0A0N5CNW5_THECL|nr:unnamed protein product [Thelazia callipaeda]